MWPIKSALVPYLVAALVVALGVWSYSVYRKGYRDGEAATAHLVQKMQAAGAASLAKRQETVKELRGKSLEDAKRIVRLSRDARVRVCTEPGLPAGGNGTDPSPPGDDREAGEDITDLLRQCLRTFGEVNRAIQAE